MCSLLSLKLGAPELPISGGFATTYKRDLQIETSAAVE